MEENNGEMNLLMSKEQHLSWGHHTYVKKLFGTLFSFSKTNIQSPKFASF
jgi:hypothetical protein